MLVCRSAWQRLAPLTQRATASTLLRNAPIRQMSASSVPGSSGEALPYYLFVAVSVAGGVVYAYRTVARDRARANDRHEYIETQVKPLLDSIKDDSMTVETGEVSETTVGTVEAVIAEEVTEEEAASTTSLEQEQPATEEEASLSPSEEESAVNAEASTEQGVTEETAEVSETTVEAVEAAIEEAIAEEVTEQEAVLTTSLEQEQPVAEEEATLSPSEEESAVSAVASIEQVDLENAEPVAEALAAETSPVLEANSDNIAEELSSAAEDWSELSARKPEESVEISDAPQESEEAVETEVAASS